jgi:hypothetical protein
MSRTFRISHRWFAAGLFGGLVCGLVGGAILANLWPESPVHASATDRINTFAVATGAVDEDVEAVFFLDFLTGDLRAAVINKNNHKFMAFFEENVLDELGVDPAKNPKFMMVTGVANLRRGSGVQPGRCVVYVAEVTTGTVVAYGIPWAPGWANLTQPLRRPLVPLDMTRFRTAVPTAPVGGP